MLTAQEKSQRKRRLLGIKHDTPVPADDRFVMCLRPRLDEQHAQALESENGTSDEVEDEIAERGGAIVTN